MATGPLVVVVGPTASGKSALAMKLAKKFNGELICADSRTVYRGMDIGTAKPSKKDKEDIRHHLLDILEPDQPFNVGDFKRLAEKAVLDIQSKGKLPIMVGGTGLYIDSVIFNYQFSGPESEKDIVNPRHLKKTDAANSEQLLRANTLVIGLDIEPKELEKKIENRVRLMVNQGLEEEVRKLSSKYGWIEALTAVGYQEWRAYFESENDLRKTEETIVIHTRQYAKRQRTWFKRNKYIQWTDTPVKASALVEQFLANLSLN